MLQGAALAAEREPELVIFDGSGAAIPPVETDARVLVTSVSQREVATEYLNAYRILVSDLVIVTGGLDEELVRRSTRSRSCRSSRSSCGQGRSRRCSAGAWRSSRPRRRPRTTAIERHLREELGAEVVLVSGNLARREALREDLARAREAEVYLVEIKAAAIDVVAEDALERGVEVVFADNELVPVGVLDLDTELVRLADQAIAREAVAS